PLMQLQERHDREVFRVRPDLHHSALRVRDLRRAVREPVALLENDGSAALDPNDATESLCLEPAHRGIERGLLRRGPGGNRDGQNDRTDSHGVGSPYLVRGIWGSTRLSTPGFTGCHFVA